MGKQTDKTPFLGEAYILAFGVSLGGGGGKRQKNGQKSHETYPLAKDFKCYREIQSRERGRAKLAWGRGVARTGAQLPTSCLGLFLYSTPPFLKEESCIEETSPNS